MADDPSLRSPLLPPVHHHPPAPHDNNDDDDDARSETRPPPLPPLQAFDCWGRPSTRPLGGWKAANFLLGANILQCLGMSGCTVNLVLFMVRILHQDNAMAANTVTNWVGTTLITSLVGASVGDSYIGRLWTSIICQVLFVMGLLIFCLSGSLISSYPSQPCIESVECVDSFPPSYQIIFFYTSLYVMGIGTASLAPNAMSLGADQFDSPEDKSTFINLHIAAINTGMLFSTTVISYLQNEGQWALGFWLSAGAGVLGFILFLSGMPCARQFYPGENPLLQVARVFVAAVCNHKAQVPSAPKLQCIGSFRWLDKAAAMTAGKNDEVSSWKVCTLDHVEEVKSVCRLMPFWICGILVACVLTQKGTLFMLQGTTLDNHMGSLEFPPSSMGLFSLLTVVVGAPIYSWMLAPCLVRMKKSKEFTPFDRMAVGLVIAIGCLFVAAVLESQRLRIASRHARDGDGDGVSTVEQLPMSIFWLVPQYVLEGLTSVFFGGGHLELNYTYSPNEMRSLATAISLSGLAMGNYLSSFIVHIITSTTNWIPKDLNEGHLDRVYWLLDAMLLFTLVLLLVFTRWHSEETRRKGVQVKEGRDGEDTEKALTLLCENSDVIHEA